MRRSEQREHIFRLLFLEDFHPDDERPQQLELYFDRLDDTMDTQPEYSEEDQAYIRTKYAQVCEKLPDIDARLNTVSEGWKTERMSRVDLALIRLALYEMLYDDKVPVKVAINEAVEIAKKYGGADSPSFVNGILARLV